MSIVRPIARPLASPLRGDSLPWEESGGAGRAPWTPASLTALRGWYRADLGVTLVGSDVDGWADQSGVGNHLLAMASGNRPLFVASAGHGRPAIEFDGVAEYLRCAAFSLGGAAGPISWWMVVRDITSTNGDILAGYGAGGRPLLRQNTNKWEWYTSGATASITTTTPGTDWYLLGGTWDGATQRIYIDGSQEDSDANAGAATADGGAFAVGATPAGGGPANIRVSEMIVQRAETTASERTALAAYATARYGL